MISSPHNTVEMHTEEFGLYEAVVAAARNVASALSHGRDPSRESVRKLQAAVRDLDAVSGEQQVAWDDYVRDN